MGLDPKILEALRTAVQESGQPPSIALKLAAWMVAVTSGNESFNDEQAVGRHLSLLFEETVVDAQEED